MLTISVSLCNSVVREFGCGPQTKENTAAAQLQGLYWRAVRKLEIEFDAGVNAIDEQDFFKNASCSATFLTTFFVAINLQQLSNEFHCSL